MTKTYKPQGYNSASPYFIVAGAANFIDFLKQLFDAKECRMFLNPDGSIMHAELMIDDSIIMIGDASEQYPPNKLVMHVYVPDAVKTYHRALDLGCTSMEEPANKPGDPDLRGSFLDKAGNFWSVGTQL